MSSKKHTVYSWDYLINKKKKNFAVLRSFSQKSYVLYVL